MADGIEGLWVALATPLTVAGSVDVGLFARHARALMEQGCDGVVPFGTTGEGPSFTPAERLVATEALLAAGIPADRVALGTGCTAIPDTVALTRNALKLGLTHVLILPPFFFRTVTAQGLEDAFAAIIDGVGSARLRATLYHIPQVSGVPVPPEVLGRLRRRYGAVVAGVKDSSGDFAGFQAFRAAAPDCASVVGSEVDIARALDAGGTGTVCGMANVAPGLVQAMFGGAEAEPAMRAACALLNDANFIGVMKSVLAAQSGDPAWRAVRPPLRAADAAAGVRIAGELAKIG